MSSGRIASRGRTRSVFRIVAVSPLLALVLAPPRAVGQETITVQPAGTANVREMAAAEAGAPRAAVTSQPAAAPKMPKPAPRELPLPSGVRREALAAISPPPTPSAFGPTVGTNFQALGDDGSQIPPDTQGAVGPAHVMTMVNSQVHIQDKAGNEVSLISLFSFWNAGTGLSGVPFDPHLIYDSISGRWIAACDANAQSTISQVFFAISATSDPTGTWTFYSFTADGTGSTWADYPGVGVNATWVAITNNMFGVGGAEPYAGAKMWVIDTSTALAGGALTLTVFPTGFDGGGFTLVPAVTFSASEPALYLADEGWMSGSNHLIRLSRITGTGPSPSWSRVPGGAFPAGLFFVDNEYSDFMIDAPQSGVTATCNGGTNNGNPCSSNAGCPPGLPTSSCRLISTNDPRIINHVNRNGKLWFAHAGGLPVGAVDRTAAFWYQVDPSNMAAPIVQSGVLDGGPGVHHFFPSITSNNANDAVVGFSRSDAGRFAEAAYTSRFAGDPPGTMDPVSVLKAGEATYLKDFGSKEIRWGDYTATVIDPTDDLTFWTIQEYAASPSNSWGLWWGRLLPGPTSTAPTPTPSTTETPTPTPTPTAIPIDHFTCYKAGATSGSVKFLGIPFPPGISLVDAFGPSQVEVKKPTFLCAPTDKNGEDPSAPTDPEHLTAYQIKSGLKPALTAGIRVVDQFNPSGLFIDAKKTSHLLVPTMKSLSMTPPTPAAFVTDHFQCYKVSVSNNTPKFTPIPALTITDQFGTMTVAVKKPKFLCKPVDKNGEDPTAPSHVSHLMCYLVKQADAVKFTKIVGTFVNNQFGPETLDVKKPAQLCLPAVTTP